VTVADLPALEFLSSLADNLAAGTVDLPAFPQVVIKVQEAFTDPNYTPQKVARVISTERTLADRLLQMANSTAFNVTGRVIIDLGVAINRLGAQKVYSVAIGHAVAQIRHNEALRSFFRSGRQAKVAPISRRLCGRSAARHRTLLHSGAKCEPESVESSFECGACRCMASGNCQGCAEKLADG
jgi:hypothetical protein